ncbi:phage tail tape measure protein [Paenibacillus tyrfis]|uniref:Phage tail tape measure protein domain-containing protein n=1 Tax=Paenibacillus tyrfis TaxID=1501230 RepID=A0A081NWQ5_9BACL|nr:phage tail tape measure protein [Paenibacillus tyrfis]KEQ22878.1 hypothetical protein ET33_21275 [Paenibacillus tyrfis]
MGVIGNLMFAVGFKVTDGAVKKAEKSLDNLKGGAYRADKSISKLSSGFGTLATAGAAALGGLSFAALGHSAISAAQDFENATSKIKGATGATGAQLEEIKGIAQSLYNQNFGENWGDLAKSLSVARQITKQQGTELEKTTKNALLLRDTFEFDITESIKTADTMMKNFGISSTEAFNLLAQGTQNGLDKSGELLDSANEYAPQFKALGFTANEMFDIFSAGLEAGAFNLDKVGDALKEFNIRAKDGSKSSTEAFQMLGLDVEEMMKTFASGGPKARQAFSQVMQMIADIEDPVQRNTVGVGLMGTQFEDLEATVIASMGTATSQFDMTRNTMDELNKTKFENMGQALESIGRQIETGLLIPFGQKLLPLMGSVSTAVDWAIKNFDVLSPILASLAVVIGGVLTFSLWNMAAAAWAATAPLLPFIAIVLGIGAAITGVILIFKNWGSISTWLIEKWNQFKAWVINIFQAIGSFFSEYWPYALALLTGPLAPTVMLIITYWDEIKTFTISVFTAVASFFTNIWNSIVTGVTSSVTGIWTEITNIWNNIMTFFQGINLFDTGKDIIQGLINGVMDMHQAVVEKVKDIASGITDGVKDFLGIHSPSRVMMEVGYFAGEGLAQGLEGTEQRVSQTSTNLAQEITSPYLNPGNALAPAAAPASVGGGATDGAMRIDVHLTVDVNGSTNGTPIVNESEEQFKRIMQEAIESAMRRMGLAGGVNYGNA